MINIEELLLPIEKNDEKSIYSVCGKYLKYDHIYDQIKEFRREDDPSLTQGIWQTTLKKASWKDVIKICTNVLKTDTKDLQIAAWLTEALIVTHGLQGLNIGILLLIKLCEKFWDDIYPSIDWENRDMTARVAPFFFLFEKIQEKILQIPITSPIDSALNSFTLSDWMMMRHNMKIKNSTGVSAKDLKKSVISTSIEFFQQIEIDINIVLESIRMLDVLLEKLCKSEGPSFQKIYDRLNDILHINNQNTSERKTHIKKKEKNLSENSDQERSDESKDEREVDFDEKKDDQSGGATIDQAYEALNDITIFLEAKQPQSPVSILLKIANAIGKKTFQELLEINMQNGSSVMSTISELYKILK